MKSIDIARVCYEANRAYCLALDDDSFLPWSDAPEWQRHTILNGVQFHIDNPESAPSDSHENWLKEKIADGWKYGTVKNIDEKEHPCCVSFEELPKEQQVKDVLLLSIVRALTQ